MSAVVRKEYHPVYGEIKINISLRARRIILRARNGIIEVTLPSRATRSDLVKALDKHGEKLLADCRKSTPATINSDYRIESENFCFSLSPHPGDRYFIRYEGKRATLFYPHRAEFSDSKVQELLRKVRETALRRIAKEYLPQRLQLLAVKHGFSYRAVSLRSSRTRWGSCSNKRNISLSIYLQLLPTHLSDYVMLHELCHTMEMNHQPPFWALMDKVTAGEARRLRNELKGFRTDF